MRFYVMFCLWMHVIYYLEGLGSLIGMLSIMEEPTPIPLNSMAVVTP